MDRRSRRKYIRSKIDGLLKRHTDDVPKKMFYGTDSIRLTRQGYIAIQPHFTHWSFDTEKNWGRVTKVILALDNTLSFPYYLDKTKLVLFEEETAMWLKMYGNVDTWLEIFKKDANNG